MRHRNTYYPGMPRIKRSTIGFLYCSVVLLSNCDEENYGSNAHAHDEDFDSFHKSTSRGFVLKKKTISTLHEKKSGENIIEGKKKTFPVPSKIEHEILWAPSKGNTCQYYKGKKICDGPRKVPVMSDEAIKKANELGLGTSQTVPLLMQKTPLPQWVEAVGIVETSPFLWPIKNGKLWRTFGWITRNKRKYHHSGIDIGAAEGTKIHSVNRGLVAYSDNTARGYGNMMVVVHGDSTVAFYAHCRANYVSIGEIVRQNQVIGEVGQTGIAYGSHLHFELRYRGKLVNPLPYFQDKKGLLGL